MRFLNAVAWLLLAWSIAAILLPWVFMVTERNLVVRLAREAHLRGVLPLRSLIFAVSLLWLIFGG